MRSEELEVARRAERRGEERGEERRGEERGGGREEEDWRYSRKNKNPTLRMWGTTML